MEKKLPPILYRYRPLGHVEERELQAIEDDEIYLSNPRNFDDPWDCALTPWETVNQEFLNDYYSNLRVACFTTREDNTRMWSHYAGDHSGICLGYSTTMNPSTFDPAHFEEVKYSSEVPVIPYGFDGNSAEAFEKIKELISTKSLDWKDQEEWRFVEQDTGHSCLTLKSYEELVSITFGIRCTRKEEIMERFEFSKDIEFKEIYSDSDSIYPKIRMC